MNTILYIIFCSSLSFLIGIALQKRRVKYFQKITESFENISQCSVDMLELSLKNTENVLLSVKDQKVLNEASEINKIIKNYIGLKIENNKKL